MAIHKLFVYGTLKSGQSNHETFLSGLKGQFALVKGFTLYQGPGYPLAARGEGTVQGELYEVDESTLQAIDAFEDCPLVYRRERTAVRLPLLKT